MSAPNAAAEIGAEVVLDPLRHAVAVGVGRGVGEEGLEVVLDERVEGRGGGIAAAVDGAEAIGPRLGRQLVRVGAGVGMPPRVRLWPGRWNGGAGQGGAARQGSAVVRAGLRRLGRR